MDTAGLNQNQKQPIEPTARDGSFTPTSIKEDLK